VLERYIRPDRRRKCVSGLNRIAKYVATLCQAKGGLRDDYY